MNFSPADLADVKERAAKIIAEEAIKEAGGASSLVILNMASACQMTGLSRNTLPRRMETVEMSPGKHGVRLKTLLGYLADKTVEASTKKQRPGS